MLCIAAQKQGERFLCGRAELIDELETAAPGWLRRRNAAAWVHFLKVRPGCALKDYALQGSGCDIFVSTLYSALRSQWHLLCCLFTDATLQQGVAPPNG